MDKMNIAVRVKIKEWEDMEIEFGLDEYGEIDCLFSFTSAMREHCGKMLIVEIDDDGSFRYDNWVFSRDMYELVEEEQENKVSHIAIGGDSMLKVICDKLGVSIGERWLADNGKTYQVDKNGDLLTKSSSEEVWVYYNDGWASLISGKLKPAWKPTYEEEYYVPDITNANLFGVRYWNNTPIGHQMLENKLIYRTKEEAIETANEILQFIKGKNK